MPDIDSEVVRRFVNGDLRPRAEKMRDLGPAMDDILTEWFATYSALIPNDASVIIDQRETVEGIPNVTGAQVHSLINAVIAMKAAIDPFVSTFSHFAVDPVVVGG